jgi:CDP-glucose 4,6-dehydratase
MRAAWGETADAAPDAGPRGHEAGLLRLDCSKVRAALGWRPALKLEQALGWIVDWHKTVAEGGDARAVTLSQIADYPHHLKSAAIHEPIIGK